MIVVMKKEATQEEVDHMTERVESLGLKAHVIVGTERTVIAAIGEKREQMKESLESGSGVAEVVPILAPYKVASREVKPDPTVVTAGSLRTGAGTLGVIAGPCSVESEEQIISRLFQDEDDSLQEQLWKQGQVFLPRREALGWQGRQERQEEVIRPGGGRSRPGVMIGLCFLIALSAASRELTVASETVQPSPLQRERTIMRTSPFRLLP